MHTVMRDGWIRNAVNLLNIGLLKMFDVMIYDATSLVAVWFGQVWSIFNFHVRSF